MEHLFSIGELAHFQGLSKQTLIYYDKIGLFCPAYMDPKNGYRYYSSKQIDYLDTILIMKQLGFSLAEIREHMQHYTIDSSLAAMKKQLQVIDRQLKQLRLIRSRLVHRCQQMEHAAGYREEEAAPQVEQAEKQYLLLHPVEPPYTMTQISLATKGCFAEAFGKQLPVFFQCGVVVPIQRILEKRYTEASFAFLPIEKTEGEEHVVCLPAGTCAAVYHVGDYQSVGRSYERLLDYCRNNQLEILSDSYEFCINDYITSRDEKEYITKIMFYVREQGQEPNHACNKGAIDCENSQR